MIYKRSVGEGWVTYDGRRGAVRVEGRVERHGTVKVGAAGNGVHVARDGARVDDAAGSVVVFIMLMRHVAG